MAQDWLMATLVEITAMTTLHGGQQNLHNCQKSILLTDLTSHSTRSTLADSVSIDSDENRSNRAPVKSRSADLQMLHQVGWLSKV